MGLFTDAGKTYQIGGWGHGFFKEINAKPVKYAEPHVLAAGEIFSKNGLNMIVISKVKGL